jgi:hypothetical protein
VQGSDLADGPRVGSTVREREQERGGDGQEDDGQAGGETDEAASLITSGMVVLHARAV